MEYDFKKIEKELQQRWRESGIYSVPDTSARPKCYVLDMFPYPSGTGLHVGHPLGYIASDIYARYKRLQGFNVLHPMGYDSFGLPAEQYALDTGQHPAVTTENNINTFRGQMENIGFSYDWGREIRTSDPRFYKWTQWIFLQIFNSWYDKKLGKARNIKELMEIFAAEGNTGDNGQRQIKTVFSATEWNGFTEAKQQELLMEYRLAYSAFGEVNWCEALGTVLANDEVINGVSERGGYPVEKKKMRQWYLRITDYAERLLQGLDTVDFSDAMKEMQKNWIGRSEGAEVRFPLISSSSEGGAEQGALLVYTTRPDTIFGVDFMVLAPEHELVQHIVTGEQNAAVEDYLGYVKSRSERERLAEVKQITGVFTGAYARNPLSGQAIPVWISEYVLAGYGTGAIMAVPCGDQRDFNFATHFNIPITNIIGDHFNGKEANPTKEAVLINSGFLDGLRMKDAISVVNNKLEELGIGKKKINYKMRDAGFSRQRYWGEPFPVIYENGIAYAVDEKELPVELPYVESYRPGPEGQGPLANIPEWVNVDGGRTRETNTMPGYAGSSWYFLRYMDPHNDSEFAGRKNTDYWNQVDVYVGGTEHAVGHLLYSRLWTKILFDLGYISFEEPFKKLVNQGMIQGSSRFVYRLNVSAAVQEGQDPTSDNARQVFISGNWVVDHEHRPAPDIFSTLKHKLPHLEHDLFEKEVSISRIHVDVRLVDGVELDVEAFRSSRQEYSGATFIMEDGNILEGNDLTRNKSRYICHAEVEKMSKSKYNTVNPNTIIDKYGADTFRMYEMFLGPIEQSKPWDTKGIEGVHRFLKKLWRLFYDEIKGEIWNGGKAGYAELKILHKAIKKIQEDTERFSFNTAVSAFMVCVNELTELKCHKKEVLEPLLILISPYAPHIAEELYQSINLSSPRRHSVIDAAFPQLDPAYLVEAEKEYPVSINGKLRTTINISLEAAQPEVEKIVLENEVVQKWMAGKPSKKIIFVKGKMVNVVI